VDISAFVHYPSTEIVFEVKFSTPKNSCSVSVAHRGHLQNIIIIVFMAALRSRCGHHIFAMVSSSSFFLSSPNLSGRRVDVYHTSTHGVALMRI